MPARLAAMLRMLPELEIGGETGAVCAGVEVTGEIGARVVERLTTTAAAGCTTGAGTGLGLTTPVKPISPKVWGASGAWAAKGAATATATTRATGAVFLSAGVAAEAGRAREATMAPDMTNTADALLAGLAERETADEKEDAELK